MPTPAVRLVHPDRPGDELIVSTAAARVHKRAGWVEAEDDAHIPSGAKARTAWIGTDPDRARAALADEQSRAKPRKSVLDHIETVTTPISDDESQED